ncbi:MAG: hypothetical protein QGF74_03410 [Candidatus Nanoarchaeia archaeon]|jgi:hypothetical protein|nr:hypothetical protein [Candidatus Nanoarchaeia archaeon]|tara:strand:- start:12938 stop:13180 length:243 start_codon:yes stop_codon:yes gene_type:complete
MTKQKTRINEKAEGLIKSAEFAIENESYGTARFLYQEARRMYQEIGNKEKVIKANDEIKSIDELLHEKFGDKADHLKTLD